MKFNNETFYIQAQISKGLGTSAYKKIIKMIESLSIEPHEILGFSKEKIKSYSGLSEVQIDSLFSSRLEAESLLFHLNKRRISVIGYFSEVYPKRFDKTLGENSPFVIYTYGNLDLLKEKAVGFCGSRDASEKGKFVAEMAALQIAQHNWAVVSGNARGIDTRAHTSALMNGGFTVFVAPEGILKFRPRAETKAFANPENSLAISEFKPNDNWSVQNAMQRNHTICGVSNAMVLVQSGKVGGTFEAGNFALKAKLPLFVADYADSSVSGPGNPYFIDRGAKPIRKRAGDDSLNLDALFYEVEDHFQRPPIKVEAQSSLFTDLPI